MFSKQQLTMLNKLRSSVTSTVSQLSGVLPGNPVTREYEATKLIGTAGPGLIWKIYAGYKKSTKQEAAIFVFEKKQLETRYASKQDKDAILENAKRGVAQLTRLRHPCILTVQHPLEESRESLAFATEPVFASLANVLGIGVDNDCTQPTFSELKDFKLSEVEIIYGLLQLGEGLAFLHNDVKIHHGNICPENVIINKSGSWRLFGFEFGSNQGGGLAPSVSMEFKQWESNLHAHAQPNLDFLAPELASGGKANSYSDIYSLGCLICALYNDGRTPHHFHGSWSGFKSKMATSSSSSVTPSLISSVASDVRDHLKMMLSFSSDIRPDAHQFTKLKFFENVGAKTLQYIDSMFQWDNLQKSQFYKGLPQVLSTFPKRTNLHHVLPCLVKEFVNPNMVPFVLPNVLLISRDTTKEEYQSLVFPHLKPVLIMQEPIQILLILLQHMELLLTKTETDDMRNHVFPMIYHALESDARQIQELCLSVVPTFAHLVDYPTMKNHLIPKIRKLCLHTQILSVRVNCLICVGKLLEHVDKWLVLDDIIPMMAEVPSKEPAVVMAILGIYKLAMTHKKLGITKEVIATKVLPFLIPLSIENSLNVSQFNSVITVIKEMICKVEVEHRAKLEQLSSIQQQHSGTVDISAHLPTKDELIPKTPDYSMFDGIDVNQVNPTQNGTSLSQSKELTMEEKESLAKQQELTKAMQGQRVLNPSSAYTPAPQKPKDLTSSLINSNLANMSLSQKQTSPLSPNFGAFQSAVPAFQSAAFPGGFANPQPAFQSFQSAVYQPGFAPVQPQQAQPLQKVDLKAFDSLLSGDGGFGSKGRVSMNSMAKVQPSFTPMMPTISNSNNNGALKKLDDKTLEDLLS